MLTGYQGMVAFVLPASGYHQPMHCSFLQFKWSQGDRIEVVPQNLSEISLCSGKIEENLKRNCGIVSVGKGDLRFWKLLGKKVFAMSARAEAEELSAPELRRV